MFDWFACGCETGYLWIASCHQRCRCVLPTTSFTRRVRLKRSICVWQRVLFASVRSLIEMSSAFARQWVGRLGVLPIHRWCEEYVFAYCGQQLHRYFSTIRFAELCTESHIRTPKHSEVEQLRHLTDSQRNYFLIHVLCCVLPLLDVPSIFNKFPVRGSRTHFEHIFLRSLFIFFHRTVTCIHVVVVVGASCLDNSIRYFNYLLVFFVASHGRGKVDLQCWSYVIVSFIAVWYPDCRLSCRCRRSWHFYPLFLLYFYLFWTR